MKKHIKPASFDVFTDASDPSVHEVSLTNTTYGYLLAFVQRTHYVAQLDLGVEDGDRKLFADYDAIIDAIEETEDDGELAKVLAAFVALGASHDRSHRVGALLHTKEELDFYEQRDVLMMDAKARFDPRIGLENLVGKQEAQEFVDFMEMPLGIKSRFELDPEGIADEMRSMMTRAAESVPMQDQPVIHMALLAFGAGATARNPVESNRFVKGIENAATYLEHTRKA